MSGGQDKRISRGPPVMRIVIQFLRRNGNCFEDYMILPDLTAPPDFLRSNFCDRDYAIDGMDRETNIHPRKFHLVISANAK